MMARKCCLGPASKRSLDTLRTAYGARVSRMPGVVLGVVVFLGAAVGATVGGAASHAQSRSADVVHEELFSRLNILEEEIRQLRATVELQAAELGELRKSVAELSTLEEQISNLGNVSSGLSGNNAVPGRDRVGTNKLPLTRSPLRPDDEQHMYRRAYELIGTNQYEASLDAFHALIERFPSGGYTARAWYWIGELHLAARQPNHTDALNAFHKVVDLFPLDRKTPDAMYKIGTIYHHNGDLAKATQWLRRVREEYQQSAKPVADLANAYMDKHDL